MKNHARKLLALLLALCLFVGVLPTVSAYDLKVADIDLQTRAMKKIESKDSAGYEFLYQSATTMIDDLAEIVAIKKDRWEVLDKLVWTCTLTDILTARLATDVIPQYFFISCKLKGEDVFVPLKDAYVADGSIKLEYRLNPKLEAILKSSTFDEVSKALVSPMEMSMYPAEPKYAPVTELEGIKTIHTTATIVMTTNDGSDIPYYNAPSALLAKGEADMELPEIGQPPYILDLVDNHDPFMQGYPDKTFKPDASITRAEVAMMLYRRLRDPDDIGMTIPDMDKPDGATVRVFADVDPDQWYAHAIYTLANRGYIQGTNMGNYRPDDPITRAEMCVLLTRFAHPTGDISAQTEFSDVPASHWAHDAIMMANALGWVQGIGGDIFQPDRYITRAEAAKMFCVMLGRTGDALAQEKAEGRFFPDVSLSHWAYMYIAEATTRHEFTELGGFEVWTKTYDFDGNPIGG